MRVAVGQFRELSLEDITFASQLGASGITLNHPDFQSDSWRRLLGRHGAYRSSNAPAIDCWEYMDLLRLRTMVEDQGLNLEAIENVPGHYMDKIHMGAPGRDEQIEAYCRTIRNMGRAGIHTLGYTFNITRVWRTSQYARTRGGAYTSAFDYDRLSPTPDDALRLDHDQVWDNYRYFIEAVLPVAEESGVRLALHPDDPPCEEMGGIGRIMVGKENLKKVFEMGDSEYHGLDMCMGTCAERSVEEMYEILDYFSALGKVFYAHVRNIQINGNRFNECFIDDGDIDIPRALRILKNNGFDSFIIDDHVPQIVDDTPWGHRARAHALGYLQGLVTSLESE
jgi:mannonate dehydratase